MDRWLDHDELGRLTGMVVPAYFSPAPSDDLVRHLLWMTLGDCRHYVPLDHVWVVVDGDQRTGRLVEETRRRLAEGDDTINVLSFAENRGKLAAMRRGMDALLRAQPEVLYAVVRDGDGDHALSDLPHLVRAAARLAEGYGHTNLIVAGARGSRHRPMGWVRGELETLLDRVTLDALAYRLARHGRALNLAHCRGDRVPDLSTGYKVYGRDVAQYLFIDSEPNLACLSEDDYWHYGPETVTVVEAILAGAEFAEVRRLTWDGQPTSSFNEFRHVQLYGELMAWVFSRLAIPPPVAARLFDNAARPLHLGTIAPGADTLARLRAEVLGRSLDGDPNTGAAPPPPPTLPFI
jgi:hypothetical protein